MHFLKFNYISNIRNILLVQSDVQVCVIPWILLKLHSDSVIIWQKPLPKNILRVQAEYVGEGKVRVLKSSKHVAI